MPLKPMLEQGCIFVTKCHDAYRSSRLVSALRPPGMVPSSSLAPRKLPGMEERTHTNHAQTTRLSCMVKVPQESVDTLQAQYAETTSPSGARKLPGMGKRTR